MFFFGGREGLCLGYQFKPRRKMLVALQSKAEDVSAELARVHSAEYRNYIFTELVWDQFIILWVLKPFTIIATYKQESKK